MSLNNQISSQMQAAWQMIREADSVMLTMHANPDGDALGSGLAMYYALSDIGVNVQLVCPQCAPDVYEFLNPDQALTSCLPVDSVDLAIVLDCDRPDRVGALEHAALAAKKSLVIDHHPPTSDFGDIRITATSYAATAEVVFHLLQSANVQITHRISEALLTGIITDTGGLRFRNTSPETLEVTAQLARLGPSTAEIIERVYDTRPYAGLKLLARVLNSLQRSPRGKVAWAKLAVNDFAETGARSEDTEGFVNIVHSLKGADVAAFLREEEPGRVRVSLRSAGRIQVKEAAEALGGGGHELAAACILEMPLEDAEQKVLEELKKWTEF